MFHKSINEKIPWKCEQQYGDIEKTNPEITLNTNTTNGKITT
jgi:hypothetical protein